MQDFRPRLGSSSYQPRHSLSHLVSKFENTDSRATRTSYAAPRRTKTLPAVQPGQWLSSSNMNEKQPPIEPETPSSSTFGHRHKSVAERRKMFENPNSASTDHPSGTRVFSRHVARDPSRPSNSQALLHVAVNPSKLAESRSSIEASKQVRRMPRLEVARSRSTPADEPEWPLKSDSPLRASFGSGHATRTSAEWKPSPARQRSLSRRRGNIGPARIDTTRTWSSETSTTDSAVEIPFNPAVGEGKPDVLTPVQDALPAYSSEEVGGAREQSDQPCEHLSRPSSALPESHAIPTSIGYPTAHPTAPPVSNKLPGSTSNDFFFPSKHSGSGSAKQPLSPLKDKIGMFESLSRQGSVAASVKSIRGDGQQRPVSLSQREITKPSGPLNRTASRIKATLRKISVSWEWGHAKRAPASGKEGAYKCSSPGDEGQDESKEQPKLRSAADTPDYGPDTRVKIRRFLSPASYPSDEEKPLPPVPHNSLRRKIHHTASSIGASYPVGVTTSAKTASIQLAPGPTTPSRDVGTGANGCGPTWDKRSIVKDSEEPAFARVQCKLDQPHPVKGDELRRLVTLCKDSALGRRSRDRTV